MRYFRSQGLVTDPTAFDGRSDYGAFIANGRPAGGLFTGAEGIKTQRQESIYGGFAGLAFDPCYHQACDTFFNLSYTALDQMSDAAAHATWTLARSRVPPPRPSRRRRRAARAPGALEVPGPVPRPLTVREEGGRQAALPRATHLDALGVCFCV